MEKRATLASLKGRTHFLIRKLLICTALVTACHTAKAQLQAAFSADHSMGCGQLSVQFTDASTGNPSQWHWDFGNGHTSEAQNPAASFTTPGTFPVTLTVNDGINTNSHTEYITVYEPPKVQFSVDTASGCYPLGVHFTDESTTGTGGIDAWTWDFGDGSPFSSEQNPMHVYDSAGTFIPKLTVSNKAGCITSASGQKIVTNEGVTVDFSADKTFSCAAPLAVTFTATTSSAQTIDYNWDFGDGATASGKTASHTYTTKGNYTVTLTASVGGGGCQDVVTKKDYILVSAYTSDFTIPQGCAGTSLSFANTSTPVPVSASWDFGDGGTSTDLNAHHQYQKAGTYEVTLTSDFGGCQSSVTKTIKTYPSPTADFKADVVNFCGVPADVTFQNLSEGATSWKWHFGDNDSAEASQPTHSYKTGGQYTVSLLAVSDQGCADSVKKAAYIKVDAPDIRFNASDGFGCLPLKTTFSIPAASQGEIASYAWDFGDGSPVSTDHSPTHTYATQESYSVTLDVVTQSGCKFSFTRDNYIKTGTKPKAAFSADPTNACRETPVQFTNESTPPGGAWTWTFPQDNNSTDTSENPKHKFSMLGPQDVTLVVNNNGCLDTAIKTNYIQVNPPLAIATAKLASCDEPYTFSFEGDKSKGTGNTYQWDFGDGTGTSTETNPTYTYKTTGAKRVVLTVTNGDCSSADTVWVRVANENPVLSTSPQTVCQGDTVTLSIGSAGIKEFYNTFTWNDGNGNTLVNHQSNGELPEGKFAYNANGSYTPSVKISFANGCSQEITGSPITVRGPEAAFTTSTQEICQGNVVTFTDNTASHPSGTPLSRWIWSFGDGQKDTTTSGTTIHTYDKDGNFNTLLTVTDANGCSDQSTANANVLTVNPSKVNFSTPDTMVCPGSPVHWVNNSLGKGNDPLWDFGDGGTSTVSNPPDHYYQNESEYTVSLKITTDKGCTDSLTRTDYVRVGSPHALMKDSSPVKICRIFMDTSVNLSTNYRSVFWDFGDGFTSTRDTAYHIYNIPGTYTQKLVVQGYSPGCADSVTRQIIIAGPIGTAVLDRTEGCAPLGVHFSAKNVKRAVTYQWYFGNGASSNPSTSDAASYTYQNGGLFHPTLKLTDDTGCYVIVPIDDSLTVIVDSIGAEPTFSWPDVCDSNKVIFATKGSIFSQDQLGEPASYKWDFGDPSTIDDISTDTAPTYRYPTKGSYEANLEIKTKLGCDKTLPLTVDIPDSIPLTAAATADPTEICAGKTIQLHATSNAAETFLWSPADGLDNPSSPDPVAKPAASTTYTVTTTSKGSCQTAAAQVDVVVHDNPDVDAGPDLTVPTGSVVTLEPKGSSDITSWKWSPADYLNCTTCQHPSSTPRENMQYVVQVANSFGCTSSDSLKLNLVCDEGKVFIPNTFSPNGDGQNDLFYPRGRGVKIVLYFRIYNRSGQLVFERTRFQLNDQSSGWDGKMKGHVLSPDVFVYTAEMICDNDKIFQLSGNITLLR